MNISFRTNAGGEYGWGNLIRLFNLYLYISKLKKNYKFKFIIEGDEEVFNFLTKKKIKYIKLKNKISISNEYHILKTKNEKDILIVEMLDLSFERQIMYKKIYNKFVVFDDLINQRYNADYVVCAQSWPMYQNIKISDKDTKFLLGYKYFVFNKNFEKYNKIKFKKNNNKINSILVVLGGGDYDNAYMSVAMALKEINFNFNVTFIVGFASISKKRRIIKKILPNSKIISNVSNIAKYIYNSDLAIVGGGYTKIESSFLMTPCIIISVQWHQIPLSDYFSKITRSPHLGYYTLFDYQDIKKNILYLKSPKIRKQIIKNYFKIFKNYSPLNLIHKIL